MWVYSFFVLAVISTNIAMNQESPAHIPDLFRFLSTYTCFISTLIMNHDNTTHTYICNEWKNGKVAKISEKKTNFTLMKTQ